MQRSAILLILLFVISNCGVKPKSTAITQQPLTGNGNLPENVYYTNSKKFLIHRTGELFKVGPATTSYRVTTTSLENLRNDKNSYRISYWMPEMPEMPVTPAKVTMKNGSDVEVVYDISMEGLWEFILEIRSDNTILDSYSYRMTVKE